MMKKCDSRTESYIIITEDDRSSDLLTEQANYLVDVKFSADNDSNAMQSVELKGTFWPAPFILRTEIVADIAKTLDNQKAPVPDEIPYKALKTRPYLTAACKQGNFLHHENLQKR